ncbi:hypothetical protein PAPYR_8267 [Paratrimastix pyriformis]|uniref:Uncharacterized protein n=1 Tax=Paratrimastix pyriformis TaxID=342808 RepID=A0ABQ8UF83_9EUKA|nr:hypothetical protein PAPYR_8267 [Paratrimastix pyriformis]
MLLWTFIFLLVQWDLTVGAAAPSLLVEPEGGALCATIEEGGLNVTFRPTDSFGWSWVYKETQSPAVAQPLPSRLFIPFGNTTLTITATQPTEAPVQITMFYSIFPRAPAPALTVQSYPTARAECRLVRMALPESSGMPATIRYTTTGRLPLGGDPEYAPPAGGPDGVLVCDPLGVPVTVTARAFQPGRCASLLAAEQFTLWPKVSPARVQTAELTDAVRVTLWSETLGARLLYRLPESADPAAERVYEQPLEARQNLSICAWARKDGFLDRLLFLPTRGWGGCPDSPASLRLPDVACTRVVVAMVTAGPVATPPPGLYCEGEGLQVALSTATREAVVRCAPDAAHPENTAPCAKARLLPGRTTTLLATVRSSGPATRLAISPAKRWFITTLLMPLRPHPDVGSLAHPGGQSVVVGAGAVPYFASSPLRALTYQLANHSAAAPRIALGAIPNVTASGPPAPFASLGSANAAFLWPPGQRPDPWRSRFRLGRVVGSPRLPCPAVTVSDQTAAPPNRTGSGSEDMWRPVARGGLLVLLPSASGPPLSLPLRLSAATTEDPTTGGATAFHLAVFGAAAESCSGEGSRYQGLYTPIAPPPAYTTLPGPAPTYALALPQLQGSGGVLAANVTVCLLVSSADTPCLSWPPHCFWVATQGAPDERPSFGHGAHLAAGWGGLALLGAESLVRLGAASWPAMRRLGTHLRCSRGRARAHLRATLTLDRAAAAVPTNRREGDEGRRGDANPNHGGRAARHELPSGAEVELTVLQPGPSPINPRPPPPPSSLPDRHSHGPPTHGRPSAAQAVRKPPPPGVPARRGRVGAPVPLPPTSPSSPRPGAAVEPSTPPMGPFTPPGTPGPPGSPPSCFPSPGGALGLGLAASPGPRTPGSPLTPSMQPLLAGVSPRTPPCPPARRPPGGGMVGGPSPPCSPARQPLLASPRTPGSPASPPPPSPLGPSVRATALSPCDSPPSAPPRRQLTFGPAGRVPQPSPAHPPSRFAAPSPSASATTTKPPARRRLTPTQPGVAMPPLPALPPLRKR